MADHHEKFWDRKLARRPDAGFAQREWGVAAEVGAPGRMNARSIASHRVDCAFSARNP
jgi:hypothetical protein